MAFTDPAAEKAYNRKWREQNRDKILAWRYARVEKKVAHVESVKAAGCCADCGGNFPAPAMDFDHVRGEKFREVSKIAAHGGYSMDRLKAEIAKCELVCANCHRIRHYYVEDEAVAA